ncbi:MAG: methionine--tRNA ligase [Erysipelotrichaceae bacterium]
MSKKTFYLSSAIAYTSGKPHIGNVYELILADAICRYQRLIGYDVYFQTGTDEHGQKIEDNAKRAGKDPKTYADEIAAIIKEQFDLVNVSYDKFIRTTDANHQKQVQKIFKKLYEQKDIYKGFYEGLYCKDCESFFTNSQVENNKCPDCNKELESSSEEAYFFRLSKYQDRLMQHIAENPHFIQPESRKNEMINNFLKPGLQDLCVSRTSFKWGIPVDFDSNHVVYVWIDALSNYITGIDYDVDGNSGPMFKKYWPADVHLIGKDILRFHTLYWPIMLMALDIELPKKIFGHPWLLMSGGKMSKSKGNVIYTDDLVNTFGVDAVRYYCLHEMPFAQDGSLSYAVMIERINSDLANTLGNLVNRTISMSNKYFNGHIINTKVNDPLDEQIAKMALSTKDKVSIAMADLKVANAISEIMELVKRLNKYVDETEPWLLGKNSEQHERLQSVLYTLLEGIRYSAILLSAFIPETSEKILGYLNTSEKSYDSLSSFGNLEQEIKLIEKPDILFARIDAEELLKDLEAEPKLHKAEISFDDFSKLEIVVGEIIKCEKHQKADKLLVSQINIGDRIIQVVSGIAEFYQPQTLVGKKLAIITNLKEVKIRGVISQGMVLVGEGETLELIEFKNLQAGDSIS